MKKNILFVILICFCISVNANVKEEKLEKMALFSRNLIVKGMSTEHIDENGMPLIAYMQGLARIEGYNDKLFYIDEDFKGKIEIKNSKWNFDCSSFVSYILKKTINLSLLSSNYRGGNPYLVSDFFKDREHFNEITSRNGINYINLINIKDNLNIMDLIIVKDKHIAIYLGNNELAEASQTLIGKYNDKYSGYKGAGEYNLGFGITSLDNFVNNKKDDKFIVLRLKDEIIDNILNVNTSIIWPDTNKEENLVSDNETKIDVILSNTEYTDKVILNINLYDKDGLIEYKFDKDNINSDYIKIDKAIDYNLNFDISENGIYNIYVKDSFGNEVKKTIEINNIDKELPVINNLYYNDGLIIVDADDLKSGLSDYAYSFDNCITWIKESEFEVKKSGKYVVCVKDRIGNLIKDTIDVNIENPSNSTQKNNFNYFYIIYIITVFIIIVLLIIYLYTKKRGNYNV